MGFDFDRVIGENKEYLKCSICLDVVRDVVQVAVCQHLFCGQCLDQWLTRDGNHSPRVAGMCPVDRTRLTRNKLGKVPRIVFLLLDSLTISCRFATNGCKTVCNLKEIDSHETSCEYRNQVLVFCKCGLKISREDLTSHSCLKHMAQKIDIQNKKISDIQNQMNELKRKLDLKLILNSRNAKSKCFSCK